MYDLLELIASHQDAVVARWIRLAHNQPRSPFARLEPAACELTFHTCAEGLLTLMQSGDVAPLQAALETILRQRIAEGIPRAETLAVWLLYRQAVRQVLDAALDNSPVDWEQLVDRVDSALTWGAALIRARYQAAGKA